MGIKTKKLKKWAKKRSIIDQEFDVNGFIKNIIEELNEIIVGDKNNDTHEVIDGLMDIPVFCFTDMMKLGYNPDKVFKETLKELKSRKGKWNPKTQKWQKFTDKKHKKLWYKADFSDCKYKKKKKKKK